MLTSRLKPDFRKNTSELEGISHGKPKPKPVIALRQISLAGSSDFKSPSHKGIHPVSRVGNQESLLRLRLLRFHPHLFPKTHAHMLLALNEFSPPCARAIPCSPRMYCSDSVQAKLCHDIDMISMAVVAQLGSSLPSHDNLYI